MRSVLWSTGCVFVNKRRSNTYFFQTKYFPIFLQLLSWNDFSTPPSLRNDTCHRHDALAAGNVLNRGERGIREDWKARESCRTAGIRNARVAGKVVESESEPAVYLPINADTACWKRTRAAPRRARVNFRIFPEHPEYATEYTARVSRRAISRFFPFHSPPPPSPLAPPLVMLAL